MNGGPDELDEIEQYRLEEAQCEELAETLREAKQHDKSDPGNWPSIAILGTADLEALTGVNLANWQVDDLFERVWRSAPGLGFRRPSDMVPAKFWQYAATNPLPPFADKGGEKKGQRQWLSLQRHCKAIIDLLKTREAQVAVKYALKDVKALPRDGDKNAAVMAHLFGHDLNYVLDVLHAISTVPRPTISQKERAANRGNLAVVVGKWWLETTGKSPVKNKRFRKFLVEFLNIKMSDTALRNYWRERE